MWTTLNAVKRCSRCWEEFVGGLPWFASSMRRSLGGRRMAWRVLGHCCRPTVDRFIIILLFGVGGTLLTVLWTFEPSQVTVITSLCWVVSVLDSGYRSAWVQIAAATLSGNSFRQTVHTHRACVHQAAKLAAALLRVARVTAGLAESNGSLPPGLWLTSPAGWLPRTGISSGTLRSIMEYELPYLL